MGEGLAGCPLKLHASIHEGERRPRVGAFLIGSDAVHPLKPVLAMGEGVAGYLAGFHRRLRLEVPASSVKRAVDGLKVKGEPKYDAEGYLLSALGAYRV
jgi:hypothetical protein